MSAAEIITGTAPAAGRLDKVLAEASGLSRARVQALIDEGRVEIAGKAAKSASLKVAEGTAFTITIPPAAAAEARPQDIALTIAYEDAHLIVVDKPAGMVVHPAAGNPDGTLVNALLHHCQGQLSGIGGVARPVLVGPSAREPVARLIGRQPAPAATTRRIVRQVGQGLLSDEPLTAGLDPGELRLHHIEVAGRGRLSVHEGSR